MMNLSKTTSNFTRTSGLLPVEKQLMIGFTGILIPLILTGNTLVIVSYKSNRRLHTRTYTFLVSLAVSDLLVGGVNIPLWIGCIAHYDICYKAIFTFTDLFGAFASILHLTAITIERYIAICQPYFHETLPARYHKGTLIFVWVFSSTMASLSWYRPSETFTQAYSCIVFVAGFVLPVTIVISMYIGIFRTAKSLIRRQQRPYLPAVEGEGRQHTRKDQKLAVTVAVICGLFIIAWLPFFILSIIAAFCYRGCFPANATDTLRIVTSVKWLHYSNSMVNPIVYALRDEEMRNTFYRILRFKACRNKLTIPKAPSKTNLATNYTYNCSNNNLIGSKTLL
ncbi:octopamine receptor Oamb-like [Actinia tenebrosa]|uniref:Octopamine receptor Oamb-like n=1 Tax=Actinia tenebrosa TaxID=6105 RepID=A0A6P8IUL8_ACTTE|nr:octopamine receptor Oamb-like [Actinia tenebrosa]XP_031570990.1 octopamine receptor Oamb-like [Actinia tenebrosa]XP_031570991.1 octopamine receptor Oamb-like [Actinia tenebrosa]